MAIITSNAPHIFHVVLFLYGACFVDLPRDPHMLSTTPLSISMFK